MRYCHGAPMSPSLADLRMFEIISNILELFPYSNNIIHLSVYRDDGFILFNGSKQDLETFFQIANNIHPLLKFTHEMSSDSIQFLDITIFKGERFRVNQILDVKLYRKPTENFQYLERTSAHPSSVFNGFIIGEIIRIIRSSNNRHDIDKEIKLFKAKLLLRGYNEEEVNKLITKATNRDRRDCLRYKLKDKRKIPPLVLATKFNPAFKGLNKIIKKHWHLIEKNEAAKILFPRPPIIAYKRQRNLKDKLTSSKLRQ